MQHFAEFFNRGHFTIINKGTSSDLWKESEKECKTLFPWSNKLDQKTTVSMKFNFFYILPKKFHNRSKLINAIYEHFNPCFSEFFANHFLLRKRAFETPKTIWLVTSFGLSHTGKSNFAGNINFLPRFLDPIISASNVDCKFKQSSSERSVGSVALF